MLVVDTLVGTEYPMSRKPRPRIGVKPCPTSGVDPGLDYIPLVLNNTEILGDMCKAIRSPALE